MGALYAGRCFIQSSDAVDAFYSSAPPSLVSGSVSYLTEFSNVSGVWQIVRYSMDGSGVVNALSQSVAPVPSFPDCNPAQEFTDGHLMGWGVAAAMVAAWAITNLKRGW